MKAKSRFDRQVSASNARLTAISPKAIDWAYRNLVQHWAFRTPSGETACGECGHKFHHKGKSSFINDIPVTENQVIGTFRVGKCLL